MNLGIIFRKPSGGLYRHIQDLIDGIQGGEFKISLIFDGNTDISDEEMAELKQKCQGGVTSIAMKRNPSFSDLSVIRKIAKIFDENRCDIVHGHGAKGGLYARLVPLLGNRRTISVYTPHGGVLHYNGSSPLGFLCIVTEKILMRLTHGIIFESKYAETTFARKIAKPTCVTKVILNGLHPWEYEHPVNSTSIERFVYIGEIRKLKGLDSLLHGFRKLKDRGIAPELTIYGTGPDMGHYQNMLEVLGLENVRMEGFCNNWKAALKPNTCVIVPSLAESLPYTVLEAAAIGIPILATKVGGIPEILGDRDYWIDVNNADSIAQEVSKALARPFKYIQEAKEVRLRNKGKFKCREMVFETIRFYRELFH
jgi:glycosyltransferase involved in cell wall biosynthesis